LQPTVSKLLFAFTLDHLYRPPPPFQRDVAGLLQALGLGTFFDLNDPKLHPIIEQRGTVEFTRLDESSGEFVNKGSGAATLSVEHAELGSTFAIDLTLPEVIQGLYWRSPLHLELMFYKGHTVRFNFRSGAHDKFEEDILCLSATPERTRVVTGDPSHRHLMIFYQDCP